VYFGEIESKIDIYRDPISGKCLGYAFIQYTTREAARKAIRAMNGFKIND
jgi:RNA recognition motif-containing protein